MKCDIITISALYLGYEIMHSELQSVWISVVWIQIIAIQKNFCEFITFQNIVTVSLLLLKL